MGEVMANDMDFNSKGIEIRRVTEATVVELDDILSEIPNASNCHWCIQCIDTNGYSGDPQVLGKIKKEACEGMGYFVTWDELKKFSREVNQFIWLVLIGSFKKSDLKLYSTDLERYESTDYNIEVFDGWLWEVFSKDKQFIGKLEKKFSPTKPMRPDQTEGWQRF